MMPTLFLYPLLGPRALGEGIERRCGEDVAFRVTPRTRPPITRRSLASMLSARNVRRDHRPQPRRAPDRDLPGHARARLRLRPRPARAPGRAHPAPRGRTPPRLQRARVAALGL